MSGAAHRAELDELRGRAIRELGLGQPVPNVEPAIAILVGDLVAELGATVLELELTEAISHG